MKIVLFTAEAIRFLTDNLKFLVDCAVASESGETKAAKTGSLALRQAKRTVPFDFPPRNNRFFHTNGKRVALTQYLILEQNTSVV